MPKVINDAFYTEPSIAAKCVQTLGDLSRYTAIVEPSAGGGSFVKALLNAGARREALIAIDTAPAVEDGSVVKADWLASSPRHGEGWLCVGNPPFGYNGYTAAKFFNHAADHGAAVIAFVVPVSFRGDTIQRLLHKNYHIALDYDITSSHPPAIVRVCWQVWVRRSAERRVVPRRSSTRDFQIFRRDPDEEVAFGVRLAGGAAGRIYEDYAAHREEAGFVGNTLGRVCLRNGAAREAVLSRFKQIDFEVLRRMGSAFPAITPTALIAAYEALSPRPRAAP